MHWLITVRSDADLQMVGDAVNSARGSLREVEPVPMGEQEVVLFADGPADFPQRLNATGLEVLGLSPESEPEPY